MIDDQVKEFHRVMGVPDRDTPGDVDENTMRLRMKLVTEEYFEFLEAVMPGAWDIARDQVDHMIEHGYFSVQLDKIADACADIDYVVAGTRLQLGIPGRAVADEVHRSNMAKAPDGIVTRNEYGKVLKPEGWTPPDIAGVLERHGWKK